MKASFSTTMATRSIDDLIQQYEVILLDAYGVLVDADGAMAGASQFIQRLNQIRHHYYIVTNDASRSPQRAAQRYQQLGLAISSEHIITSGAVIKPYFAQAGLVGRTWAVLGSEDSADYVRDAGGRVVPLRDDSLQAVDGLVVADESGFPFLPGVDIALSIAYQKLDAGQPLLLILANPDLVYPKSGQRFGFAAGSIAKLMEAALQLRYPHRPPLRFIGLGKPFGHIFEEAVRRTGKSKSKMIMVGDQLETDIRGGNAFGIDTALVMWGVTRRQALEEGHLSEEVRPTFVINGLF